MDKVVYIAMSGAKQSMMAQAVHANNLANMNTQAFRADFAEARAMPVYADQGLPTRAYAMTERPAIDFSAGALIETGRELDVAIKDEGWIAVQTADGGEAYTRNGSLYIDAYGMLRTAGGLPVLGNGGPIAIPPAQKIDIAIDGTITIRGSGQSPEVLAAVDRIKLVNPELAQLEKRDNGLVFRRDGEFSVNDPNITLVPGFLEGSNVNAVESMTEMLAQARQYEMQVKVIRNAEENSRASARLLQIS